MSRKAGPIKVMHVIARLNIGGPAIHAILLAALLDKERFASTLVTGVEAEHEGNMLDFAETKGVAPVIVEELGRELNPVRDLSTLRRLRLLMRRIRPEIVHTHTAKAGAVGRVAARTCGVPVVVHTFHGHVFHGYFSRSKTRLFLAIERRLGRWSDAIITLSEQQRAEIHAFGIAPLEKIHVIPLGFDLRPFTDPRRGAFRREIGVADDEKLVGIVARLTPVKNHRLFLDAARLVAERDGRARFVIVGDGELRDTIERQARELGLTGRITFTGWRNDLPQVYADLDVLTLTSLNEGTPVSLIEAMASGCPVVSTAVGGVVDMIRDSENGLLAPSGDAPAIARGILRLLEDSSLPAHVRENARAFALRTYGLERCLEDIQNLYARLLRAKGAGED